MSMLLSIPRRAPDVPAPASAAQRRLWILHQLNPSGSGSNRPLALRLEGTLDVAILIRSLTEIVRRHEVLRTVFVEVEGEPVQEVLPGREFLLPLVELDEIPEPDRLEEARRIAAREAQRPFDLATGPLLRGLLLRLGSHDHVLLLLMHHIVFDGWSEGVLVGELAALYTAFAAGAESPLAEPRVQYADFAAWQRDRLRAGALEQHLGYWKQCLEPLPPPLDLPADLVPPEGMPVIGAEVPFGLGRELSDRLRIWCRRERATPFMALLSAFQATLGRQAGQERFLVGIPIAGRTRAETEGLVGCFMNVVVMRADLSGGRTFRQLVRQAREQTLESYDRQELPFERLVEALRPKRHRHRWPLFDVMFNMRTLPRAVPVTAAGLRIGAFSFDRPSIEGLSLSLQVEDGEDGFRCCLTYAAELFQCSTVDRLARQLLTFLEGAMAAPDRPVARIPLMTVAERREVLEAWNATAADDPDPAGVHELVAEQARRTPEAVAVVARARTLTFGELERRANRLGQYLRSLGVAREAVVAVYLDRSPELIVAILGILKAGAAYLPLDLGVAPERTRIMLEDAAAPVVLTTTALAGDLPASQARIVALDAIIDQVGSLPPDPPAGRVDSDCLACVVFTSGSTGRPKGVMITHGALRNQLRWRIAHFSYTPSDRILHSAPLGFDDAVWQTFAPLVSGASMVLAGPDEHMNATRLVQLIREERPTGACFVPSLLSAVLEEPGIQECTSLRMVNTGGDVVRVALRDRYHSLLPADLFNGYGPAETTIASTFWKCERGQEAATVPIGRPIANTRIYVLDDQLEPVPVGVRGELYVGGVGLARGYLNSAGATAASFIPDPFGPPGGRLYRTGDLARYRADGALEFMGRRDLQVKIRGNRVELGEIEAVLRTHPAMRDAAVAVVPGGLAESGLAESGLVGYVVASGAPPGWPELRGYLRRRLPEHMVPARFVSLPELPRTPSGKLDRAALPACSTPEPETAYVAPRSPTEVRLATLWATLLRHDRVGTEDDFFALGGHSLLATQLASRVQATFGIELSVREVFEAPTVAQLAQRIDASGPRVAEPETPVSSGAAGEEAQQFLFPTSFAQRSLWLLDQLDPQSTAYVITQAHRLRGMLDQRALEAALQDVMSRHETLRTSFTAIDGVPMQVVVSHQAISLPLTDLSSEAADRRLDAARRVAGQEAAAPFDLTRGPLFRARLLRLTPEEHVLVLAMHHIVSDGWSLGVLSRELEHCYRARLVGQSPSLPELPVQYADYTIWQHEWLSGTVLESELSHWREQLAGAPPVLRLPTDRPRPPAHSYRGARLSSTLGPALTDALRVLSREEGATLFMTLLGAFGLLLGRHSGQRDLVVGSPIAGRTRTELEGLIGFFVNTLALRLDLRDDPSFRAMLGRVRKVALGAYAHQDLPFERLVEGLRPERTLQHHPVFQVAFQMVNVPPYELRLPGLEVLPLSFERVTAKFDLSLTIQETGEGLRCDCTYSTDLFDADTITCFLQQYHFLLEQVAADPDRPVETYSLVTPESRALLPDPRAELAAPQYDSVPEAFAARALARPGAPAVEWNGRVWTYAELDAAARRIASTLRARGLGQGDRVAVSGPPSFGLVAALLATLGTGGVMVPLDPRLPERRRKLMIEQASARMRVEVVTDRPGPVGPAGAPPEALPVDAITGAPCGEPREAGVSPAAFAIPGPTDPAYMFYTSGTTGSPKAVLGAHRSLGHFLAWEGDRFGIGPGDRLGLLSNLSVDVLLRDLFLPLARGATVVLPPSGHPPDRMLPWLADERITVLHAVPSIADSWLESGGTALRLTSLRWVFFAGEPLTDVAVRRWRAILPTECGIVNLYGPTESTMVKCCYVVPDEPLPGVQPIGRPLPETQALVLGPGDRLCGIGEPGELVLRSPFLALGYLNGPGREERGFEANPFRTDPGDRCYRTGDLGRYRPDGTAVWLGRRDRQVKVFGVRVEPDEVAAVLAGHPRVRTCTVAARTDSMSGAVLTAYVVPVDPIGSGELRAWLAERLPSPMIPGRFVFLSRLPLSANGKVDGAALLDRGDLDDGSIPPGDIPRTGLERELIAIWREVLGIEQVGIHDSFFTFGGHSLLATQVIARVRSRLGVDVAPRVMFDTPTVAGLAREIENLGRPSDTGVVEEP